MHLRTRSSQPGFMDARSKLVSRDVILPERTEKLRLVTPGSSCKSDGENSRLQEHHPPDSVLPCRSCLVVKLSYVGITGLSLTGTLLATQMRHDWKSAHLKMKNTTVR